jgi:hypothetical protein
MSSPREHAGFAERLDWLQSSIACSPGTNSRFSTEALIVVLARVSPAPDPMGRARQWLADMKAERTEITDLESRRYIAALEDVFRLPPGYFLDEQSRAATDDRIAFAASAAPVRVIGPCRRLVSELTIEDLHRIHVRVVEVLNRHKSAS